MTKLAKNLVLIAALAVSLSACKTSSGGKKGQGRQSQPLKIITFDENPFKNAATANNFGKTLQTMTLNSLDKERLWANAHCQCTPAFTGKYLSQLSVARGALPQPLVPSVREQIRNDPKLKLLMGLPGGLQNVGNFLAGLFVNDEKIAGLIRTGVAEKVNRAAPGGAQIQNHVQFRFDGFPSPISAVGSAQTAAPKVFDTDVQASRWALIMGLPNMWQAEAPIAYNDHGLQTLHTAQMMSEWQYMFGLEKAANGTVYGGVTFDPREGLNGKLAGFDPRTDIKGKRVVSGSYVISYDQADQLDLAISVQEQWQRNAAKINLDEQARMWTAAATAFHRLRPKNRTNVGSLFGSSGMFPNDAHQIALVFLPGIEVLLDGMFIDEQAMLIRQYAKTRETTGPEASQPANLVTLTRLARAMNLWVEQTRDLSDAALDAATANKLRTGNAQFVKVVQLAIQSILGNHVRDSGVVTKLGSIAMVRSPQDYGKPEAAEVAETLATLAAVEQASLPSPILKQRVIGLYHWYVAEYLADVPKGKNQMKLSPQAILWSYKAMQQLAKYPQNEHRAVWLKDLTAQLKAAIDSWDKGNTP